MLFFRCFFFEIFVGEKKEIEVGAIFTFIRWKNMIFFSNKKHVWFTKVCTFWKTHKIWKNLVFMALTNQLIYLVNVKTMRKIFLNYVRFSINLNFKSNGQKQSRGWGYMALAKRSFKVVALVESAVLFSLIIIKRLR